MSMQQIRNHVVAPPMANGVAVISRAAIGGNDYCLLVGKGERREMKSLVRDFMELVMMR